MKRHLVWVLLVGSLLLLSEVSIAKRTLTPLEERPPAPEFELIDRNGKLHKLSDYRGKTLVVNFWASWCPACIEEMPSIQRGADWLQRFNGYFIAINVRESPDSVARFLDRIDLKIPLLFDLNGSVTERWGVSRLPVTYVIDPQGRMAYRALGARHWDDPMLLVPIRALGMER